MPRGEISLRRYSNEGLEEVLGRLPVRKVVDEAVPFVVPIAIRKQINKALVVTTLCFIAVPLNPPILLIATFSYNATCRFIS